MYIYFTCAPLKIAEGAGKKIIWASEGTLYSVGLNHSMILATSLSHIPP